MSASAVATRTAVAPLSVSNMDEEELREPRQQKCEELAEEPGKPSLDLDLDLDRERRRRADAAEDDEEEEEEEQEMLMLQEQRLGQDSESERLQVDAQLRAMAVSATTRTTPTGPRTNAAARAHHDAAPSTATSTGTRSAGESHDDVNGKDRLKPFIRTCQKFESGSGSGDQDGMVSMEDGTDVAAKKRKTRRGKPKHRKLKPYSKQQPSYQQRLRCRASGRPNKGRGNNNPLAPNNTNQFLMEDHNELPDLDEKIAAGTALPSGAAADLDFSKPFPPPARTRDSSFSIDSDEDFYYSSPEDEEEFLSKEFSSVYEETHAERLSALSKAQLIADYIQLESKVDSLTKRLRAKNSSAAAAAAASAAAATASGPPGDPELAKKLKAAQQRCEELQQQNDQLRRENEMLRQRHGSPMSSVDSESDSDSSSSRSHDDSDCSGCNHRKASPGSSPVPTSYHACREKSSRRKSSVSSVASETDSSPGKSSATTPSNASPKHRASSASSAAAQANGSAAAEQLTAAANGHYEIAGLPT